MVKTYDRKCYALAEAFLKDEGCATPERCDALALDIQQAIEDYIEEYAACLYFLTGEK